METPNLKVAFPSHALMDLDSKTYEKFDDFFQRNKKSMTAEQRASFATAMGTFVTLLAQLKDAERSLYR